MTKYAGKGTIFKSTIAALLTAVAQIRQIQTSGFASQTFDGTCLDSGVGREMPLTGYAEGGTVELELLWDPGLAGHQFFTDSIVTPAEIVHEITYPDSSTTDFTSSGIEFGTQVQMDDGLVASLTFTVTGLPTFPS